ncbi:MAG: peptidylprolyl isomerase [Candidatus Bathyarchaeota archaeon]
MKLTKKNVLTAVVLFLFSGSIIIGVANLLLKEPEMKETAVLETSLGVIEIELDRAKAPKTVENFIAYVAQGFYDGLIFHRVMAGFMIQGGGFEPDGTWRTPTRDPVKSEARNGLKNVRGAIAMARSAEPDSATSQFYINTVDNPNLDYPNPDGYGYTVFGKVVKGMDVVDDIEASQTGRKITPYGAMNDWPTEDIVIIRVYMKEK